eukprot:g429.t1
MEASVKKMDAGALRLMAGDGGPYRRIPYVSGQPMDVSAFDFVWASCAAAAAGGGGAGGGAHDAATKTKGMVVESSEGNEESKSEAGGAKAADKRQQQQQRRPRGRKKPSFLVVGLDTVSRAHFLRNFPMTSSFFEDAHNAGTHTLTQFMLHNVVARGTVNNMGAFYTGEPASHKTTVEETRHWIWRVMKEAGYATSFIVDTPRELDGDMPSWLYRPPGVDYTLSEAFAAVGAGPGSTGQPYQYALSGDRGRVCLGGNDTHAHVFKYAEDFHLLHRAMPRFSVSWSCAGHEDTMRVTGTYDEDLAASLWRLHRAGVLEDTAVLVVSDHGMKGLRFYETGIGEAEYRMPVAMMLLPRNPALRLDPAMAANLRTNQFRLTTHYDLHRTLWHLAHDGFPAAPPPLDQAYILAKKNPFVPWDPNPNNPPRRPETGGTGWPYAHSLIERALPLNRSCADAAIPARWCHCAGPGGTQAMDPASKEARTAAALAVAAIRGKLHAEAKDMARRRKGGGGRRGGGGSVEVGGAKTPKLVADSKGEGGSYFEQDSGGDATLRSCARLRLAAVRSGEKRVASISHENNDPAQAWQYTEVRRRVVFETREGGGRGGGGGGEGGGGGGITESMTGMTGSLSGDLGDLYLSGGGGGGGATAAAATPPRESRRDIWEASLVGNAVQHVSRLSTYGTETCDKRGHSKELCVCCAGPLSQCESVTASLAPEKIPSSSSKERGGAGSQTATNPAAAAAAAPDAPDAPAAFRHRHVQQGKVAAGKRGQNQQHQRREHPQDRAPGGDGDVRLTIDGMLEFRWGGVWGAVCNDALGYRFKALREPTPSPVAEVACRQLGKPGPGLVLPELQVADRFTLDVTPKRYEICSGDEARLDACARTSGSGGQHIHHAEEPNCAGPAAVVISCGDE